MSVTPMTRVRKRLKANTEVAPDLANGMVLTLLKNLRPGTKPCPRSDGGCHSETAIVKLSLSRKERSRSRLSALTASLCTTS